MKHFLTLLVLVCTILAACTPKPYLPTRSYGPCQKYVSAVFAGDPECPPDVQRAVYDAMGDLLDVSKGQINFVITFGDYYKQAKDRGDPYVRCASPGDPEIVGVENDLKDDYDLPEFNLLGVARRNPTRILLVPSRLTDPKAVRLLATHELAHVAGFRWPNCIKGPECVHSPDKSALMAPVFSGQPFGPADLEFCRASCLCP